MTGPVVAFGIPFDAKSSHLRGAALAPQRIRETLHDGSGNWFAECGSNLEAAWQDGGDLPATGDWETVTSEIHRRVGENLTVGGKFLAWGGDHSISYPLIEATARFHGSLTIVHLDAHPDVYEDFAGDRFSHACPFARVMENVPGARLIQIGIRTATQHQREQIERFKIACHPAAEWRIEDMPEVSGPVYLSLDLDVLDPAFAPGVSHHEPGGLSTRDVLRIIHRLRGKLVAADLVEFNPTRDSTGITAAAAAKLSKEILAALIA